MRNIGILFFSVLSVSLLAATGAYGASLYVHYDASDAANVTVDVSDIVQSLTDLSAPTTTAYDATKAGGAGTLFYSDPGNLSPTGLKGVDTNNGAHNKLLVLSAAEQDALLNFPGAAASNTGFAALVVFKADTILGGTVRDLVLASHGNGATSPGSFIMKYEGGVPQVILGGTSVNAGAGAAVVAAGETVVLAVNYNKATGNMEVWDSENNTSASVTKAAADFSSTQSMFLAGSANSGQGMDGMIGEVKIFEGVLTAEEFAAEQALLVDKWLVPVAPDADTDGDGLSDSVETNTGIYVSETDTGTDPNKADTDGDGLLDSAETNTGVYVSETDTGTDPNNADTDVDGLSDGLEVYKFACIIPQISSSLSWHYAKQNAETLGGHLATIHSDSENSIVSEIFELARVTSNASLFTFIGGTDENSEGEWEWVTGEEFTYTNWNEPEGPDNSGGIQHYLILGWGFRPDGKWDDTNATDQNVNCYMLEIAKSPDPNKADTDNDGVPDGLELTEGTDPTDADSYRRSPPASLAGKAYQFSLGGGYTWTVPLELVFGSTTYDEGFAGSLLDADQPYTYANGVVTTDGGDEIRLTFTSATAGSFEYWELDDVGFYLEDVGTFNEVTPSLVLKNDWQRTETMDSALSTNYWNVWRRTVDSVAYNAGELNFLFADGGDSANYDYPGIELEYGRTLPMDVDWQIVLDDILVTPSVQQFDVGLELSIDGADFECELVFEDYGSGREVEVFIESRGAYGDASYNGVDLGISTNLNMRIVHIASSRDLVFECQPDGAIAWTELARLNLANGGFTGSNATGGGFSGELVSTSQRMKLRVQVESGQATQLSELEIAGIEIGSSTPPVWELYDDFSGSVLDTEKWETSYWPGGLAPVIDGGQLRLENGGGVGRKDAAFMSTLQSAGIDFSSETYHSSVVLTDPSIIGIEVELFLPVGVAADSGVFIDLLEQVGPQEIRVAGVELGYWGGNQAELGFAKSAYSSGTKTSVVEVTEFVSLGQSYRVRILRQNGVIELYWDDVLIQTHAAEGELLALFIAAFNDAGQAMYATVDNVRVLRDTSGPSLPVVESSGNTDLLEDDSGYYAGSAETPLVYQGAQFSSRTYAGYTALGVDLVNGTYRVVLYNGSQYYAANFALNGSNSSAWAVVANVPAEEVKLQQDLNSDGYVGIAPPASLAGKQIEYEWNDGETSSVPSQELYGSDGYVQFGFSGSVLERTSYTYAQGVITYTDWGEEIRLSFTTPTSGTFEYYEVDYPTPDGGPNVFGTFTVVTPTLVLKNDWQRTETIDSPLSTDYWNVWRRTVDSVAYNAGALNFLFAGGGDSANLI